jgi:hypothetical protein
VITDFWREVASAYPNTVDRNADYLNWRYVNHPGGRYTLLLARNAAGIDGYIVLKSEAEAGVIMDVIARDDAAFSALVQEALTRFAGEGKALVECWMTGRPSFDKVLKKLGFGSYYPLARLLKRVKSLRGFLNPFIISSNFALTNGLDATTASPASWFISPGDTDWERVSDMMS